MSIKQIILNTWVILVYIGVPLLVYLGVLDFKYRGIYFIVFGILTYIIFRLNNFSNKEMGITNKKTKKSISDILPFTILIFIIFALLYFSGYSRMVPNKNILFILFFLFISCPLQELLYRGILNIYLFSYTKSMIIRSVIISILYGFSHIIYKDPLTMVLTFSLGVGWYYGYYKTKNLTGVVISHILLGIGAVVLGFIN